MTTYNWELNNDNEMVDRDKGIKIIVDALQEKPQDTITIKGDFPKALWPIQLANGEEGVATNPDPDIQRFVNKVLYARYDYQGNWRWVDDSYTDLMDVIHPFHTSNHDEYSWSLTFDPETCTWE